MNSSLFGRRRDIAGTIRVGFESPANGGKLPRLASAAFPGIDLGVWIGENEDVFRHELAASGAVLFRGFDVDSAEKLQSLSERVCGRLAGYVERRSPRVSLGGDVLTSTIYPADQFIHFHNEKSFACEWPMQLHLCCIRPADAGGLTPLADSRAVLARIPPSIRDAFSERGVRYVRNFYSKIGMSWQESFQTTDPFEVERFCAEEMIDLEWLPDGGLRTVQRRDAIAVHPVSGEAVWFNQAHFFHVHALPANVRDEIRRRYREQDYPQNAFLGDGSTIPDEAIEEIIRCYAAEERRFEWQRGDFLVLDNMLVAHSRTSYSGQREIALTLGDLHSPSKRARQGNADQ
jgi:alpha-ketoglutarate-dependent taurine dioxygenase